MLIKMGKLIGVNIHKYSIITQKNYANFMKEILFFNDFII